MQQKQKKKKEKDRDQNPFSTLQEDEDKGWEDDDSDLSESESESNSRKGKKWKNPVRMDFTKFSGTEDPRVWLDRARQYFGAQEIPTNKRVQWASYHLDGEANQWWRWFSTRHKKVSWGMFERGLLQRFGTTEMEEADEAIIRLRQTGAFRTYLAEFERLVNCLPHWEDKALLGAFLAGVKDELAREIRFFRPHSLEHAIELARHADEQSRSRRSGYSSVRVPPKAVVAEKSFLSCTTSIIINNKPFTTTTVVLGRNASSA